jgi:hypothetical protein
VLIVVGPLWGLLWPRFTRQRQHAGAGGDMRTGIWSRHWGAECYCSPVFRCWGGISGTGARCRCRTGQLGMDSTTA